MKRKLQWRGPHRYDHRSSWLEGVQLNDNRLPSVTTITIEGKGHRALAKRIGDFLKKEAK